MSRRLPAAFKPALLSAGAFAILGTALLVTARAASTAVAVEAETASHTPGVAVVPDTTASGSAHLRFGGQPDNDLRRFFPIGVFVPPVNDFAKWKNRGINTMVNVPDGTREPDWTAQANALGLRMIRVPAANPDHDKNEPLLLAWAQPDEPDGIHSQVPFRNIQSTYASWKQRDPARQVYINFVGNLNQYDLATKESGDEWYKRYIAGGDLISADTYPVNDGLPNDLGKVGRMVAKLRALSGNKPVFAFIESVDIDTTDANPVIKPGQLRAQIWSAIINGARGYWYFPARITPDFAFDATPADVAAEMSAQNNTVTSLALVLQSPINPSGVNVSAPAPLEVGWRTTSDTTYLFALNPTGSTVRSQPINVAMTERVNMAIVHGENRTLPIANGILTDDFAPHAVHIYRIPH